MDKPRVVIMANNVDEVGGAQRIVHVLGQALAERGYPTELIGITPFDPRHEYIADPAYTTCALMGEPWPAPIAPSGLLGARSPAVRSRKAKRARLRSEAIVRLGEILGSGPPGVIICAQIWAMEQLRVAGHGDWHVIGQYHASFEAAAGGRDLRRALKVYADIDRFALLTAEDAELFAEAGFDNVMCMPNPLSFWPDSAATLENRVITYLGRLSEEKGPEFLVDAWGLIADRYPQWSLQFVGSGPTEEQVRRRSAALQSGADRVTFLGTVKDPERVLLASGVMALPSLTEGFPLALAEAMACGLPVIASDCSPGVRALVRPGVNGLLANRGDPANLAKGLSELLESAELRSRLGRAGRESVRQYRAPLIIDRWEQVISDITGADRAKSDRRM